MKLKDCRETYYQFSGKASDIARQLAFAGIAVIWIFKHQQDGIYTVPQELILPGALLVGSLSADFLHYVLASIVWGFFHRSKENTGVNEDQEFTAPSYINWPAIIMYWSKIILVTISYFLLTKYLILKIV